MKAQPFIRAVLPYVRNSPLNPLFLSRSTTRRFLRRRHATMVGRLLDVGCGDREFADEIPAGVTRHVGLEYPPARATQGEATPLADVFGDAARLPFADATFDTVLCLCLLEHVPQPSAVLDECRRVLRPGGHLLTATPLTERIHCAPYDFHRFTPYALRQLAQQAGLEVTDVTSLAGTWAGVGSKISMYLLYNLMFTKAATYAERRVRLWTLPFGVPLCAIIQLLCLGLDHLHRDDQDAEQYFMVARRPAAS